MGKFVPDGYLPLSEAIDRAAKAAYGGKLTRARMAIDLRDTAERVLAAREGRYRTENPTEELNELSGEALNKIIKRGRSAGSRRERMLNEIDNHFRQSFFAGKIRAVILNQQGDIHDLLAKRWGTDDAPLFLEGKAPVIMSEDPDRRVYGDVLIPVQDFDYLMANWPYGGSGRNPAERTERRGRPPGSGSYARNDEILVDRMHEMVTSGVAENPWRAAVKLAPEAFGGGILESKAKRLLKRYSEKFGEIQPK
jgi:hypothetical protein